MPIHDWSKVDAGIFHDFHLEWISRIKASLNSGILPPDFYAMAEQHAGGFEPDVLALRGLRLQDGRGHGTNHAHGDGGAVGLKVAAPRHSVSNESPMMFYRRKQRAVAVRHVSGDDVVAMIEIVSPGNKDSRKALEQFVDKACWLLERGIHLLILDLQAPTSRDPNGIHGAIWDEIASHPYEAPADQRLTLASYESHGNGFRAFVEPMTVGDRLIDMPLFLMPGAYVEVPLEATYLDAFAAVPRRWREVLEPIGL